MDKAETKILLFNTHFLFEMNVYESATESGWVL